jgi:hypothetical protein
MPHKIKIGDIVHYRPKDRMLNAARGTYAVVGGPAARISNCEDFERVDPTYADAILDCIVHNTHRMNLTGHSLRRPRATKPSKD